jgi:hypothetical protein
MPCELQTPPGKEPHYSFRIVRNHAKQSVLYHHLFVTFFRNASQSAWRVELRFFYEGVE